MHAYDYLDLHVGPDPEMVDYLTDLRHRRPMFGRVIFLVLWANAKLSDWRGR